MDTDKSNVIQLFDPEKPPLPSPVPPPPPAEKDYGASVKPLLPRQIGRTALPKTETTTLRDPSSAQEDGYIPRSFKEIRQERDAAFANFRSANKRFRTSVTEFYLADIKYDKDSPTEVEQATYDATMATSAFFSRGGGLALYSGLLAIETLKTNAAGIPAQDIRIFGRSNVISRVPGLESVPGRLIGLQGLEIIEDALWQDQGREERDFTAAEEMLRKIEGNTALHSGNTTSGTVEHCGAMINAIRELMGTFRGKDSDAVKAIRELRAEVMQGISLRPDTLLEKERDSDRTKKMKKQKRQSLYQEAHRLLKLATDNQPTLPEAS